jgi:hypothetical protein
LGAHNRIAHAPVEESGRPHRPVKAEIAGSKPVGRADLPAVSRSGAAGSSFREATPAAVSAIPGVRAPVRAVSKTACRKMAVARPAKEVGACPDAGICLASASVPICI